MTFLKELWAEKSSGEKTGKTIEENKTAHELLIWNKLEREIKEIISNAESQKNKEQSETLFEDLKKSIIYYANLVKNTPNNKLIGVESREEYEKIIKDNDKRRLAHNALIDNLNILSRLCKKYGYDNNWREEMGNDRERITEWALAICETIKNNPV
ncbi:MAG: hypothetical protein PHY40_02510 [Patescibacteria group bacterium]|nr:hypothetical protein [Patescibacteria group bacterium]